MKAAANWWRATSAIAFNTFREAVRNKVFGSLVFVAVLLMAASLALGEMSLHEELRVTRDLTLFASTVFAAAITIYSSITLLYTEIEQRTIYTILSKPIRRWQFITGKFGGIVLLVVCILGLLYAISAGLIALQGGAISATLGWAYGSLLLQMMIVAAVALFLASFSSPLLSGMITAAIVIAGHLFSHLEQAQRMLEEAGNPLAFVIETLQFVLPNLESLNLSTELTYTIPIPAAYALTAGWYTVSYTAIVLVLAMIIFARRDFV